MRIKHQGLQFAAAAMLATGLSTSCSGGGSSSASPSGPGAPAMAEPALSPPPPERA